jgi:predicted secreted protein
MKLNTKATKFFAGTLLAVVATMGATGAFAGRAYELEYTYYSANGGYVGTKLLLCNGGSYTSGQVTSNYDVVRVSCEDNF